jgi:chemotaxis protein MotA
MGPAFGMIGTLVGLVQMLKSMGGDMGGLGDAMGTAIITTFYGSLEANVIFAPVESALKSTHSNEEFCMNIIVEGTIAIAEGGNPRYIREKLEMMLSQTDKKKASGGGKAKEEKAK